MAVKNDIMFSSRVIILYSWELTISQTRLRHFNNRDEMLLNRIHVCVCVCVCIVYVLYTHIYIGVCVYVCVCISYACFIVYLHLISQIVVNVLYNIFFVNWEYHVDIYMLSSKVAFIVVVGNIRLSLRLLLILSRR